MVDQDKNEYDITQDEAAVARLLRISGARDEIPMSVESRVYATVLEEWRNSTSEPDGSRVYDHVQRSWQRQTLRSRLLRWTLPVAVAASAALVAVLMTQPQPIPPVGVGTVARVISPVTGGSALLLGEQVYTDMRIETGDGEGYSFLLARNESLRLDENSTLRIDAPDRFTLLRGRVYADTGEHVYRNGALRIDTEFGAVTDIGTQFAVSLRDDVLDVAVREGRVDVRRDKVLLVAMSGERLQLDERGGATVDLMPATDAYWDWTTALAPAFEIEGKSLMEFLKWASRESGRVLSFQDSEVRMAAMRTDLHGSIEGFAPLEAIESVLATTAFRYRIDTDRIVIER
jgi:ferric-dicitrate binding protein FerR (iron transport regulator)